MPDQPLETGFPCNLVNISDTVTERTEEIALAKPTRRAFLKRTSLVMAASAVGLAGYSGLIEPNEIDVHKLEIWVERLSAAFDGFKIALLSDLHFGPYTGEREISAAVEAANRSQPDLVAILGDFVSTPYVGNRRPAAKKAEPCALVLSRLRSRFGSFAILGNHDSTTDPAFIIDALSSHGIAILRNENHPIERDGARFWLLGADDALYSNLDLDATAAVPTDEPKILLAHEPDIADQASKLGIDVQFSGHSHGGQVRFPGLRPLYLPALARKYYSGYYRVGRLQLYTNRGIGTIGVPFRFLCPPEVTLVTLRSQSGAPKS